VSRGARRRGGGGDGRPAAGGGRAGVLTEGWLVTPEEVARGLDRLFKEVLAEV